VGPLPNFGPRNEAALWNLALMKIQIYSDLHNEFSMFAPIAGDAELVILAGDIDHSARGVKWANETFSCEVIYVCGNHEFYKGHIDKTLTKMRDLAAPHVHILENEALVWRGVRFLGSTCWTDFTSSGDVVAASNLAWQWMNDFRQIRADDSFRRLRPDDVAARNKLAKAWLETELSKPYVGKTVVITHHAPTPTVAGDKVDGHLSAAYSNHWPSLLEKTDLWFFGHTHRGVDTFIGDCRVVSNPRGYPGEVTGFRAGFEIVL